MSTAEAKIKNIVVYLIPSFISNILPFITLPIITRFLSPQDFGITALTIGTMTIIINILACNVDAGTQRYYFEYRKDQREVNALINTGFIFIGGVSLVSMLPMYFLSGAVSKVVLGSSAYSLAVFLSYVIACLTFISAYFFKILRNMEQAKVYSFFTVIQMIVNTVLSIFMVAVLRIGYMGIIYSALIASAVTFILLFAYFAAKFKFELNKKMLWDDLVFGIPLLPNIFISSIYQFFDKYMLRNMISLASTGIFSIAQNISNKLFIVMTAVQSTFDPIFMKDMFDRKEEGARSVGRNFTIFTFISLSAILPVILFGEEIIHLLAPKSYYEAINVFIVLLAGISIQTFGKIVGSQLNYIRKAYLSFPVTIIGLLVNVGVNILLIPVYGAVGAAVATFFTVLITNAILIYIAQKGYEIVYEIKHLVSMYGNVFVCAFLMIIFSYNNSSYVLRYAVKAMSLAFFVYTGVKANIISKRNIYILTNIFLFRKTEEKVLDI